MKKKRKKNKKYERIDIIKDKEKILNEMASNDIIYEESQTGPQEEPCFKEIHLDIKK